MLKAVYRKVESTSIPDALDITSSPTSVYLRKNIQKKERETEEGTQTYYEYEEAVISKDQYIVLLHEEQEITESCLQELLMKEE